MIVIDASVVANALGDDGDNGDAARVAMREARDVVAPGLIDVEVTSVMRRFWLQGGLTARRFRSAVEDLGELPLARYSTGPLMLRAYELRANVTPYDAAYIALAETLGCPLVTTDARLANAPGPRCEIQVVSTMQS